MTRFWAYDTVMLTRKCLQAICSKAQKLIVMGARANTSDLLTTSRSAPWLYELGLELCRRGESDDALKHECLQWCEDWGTAWSAVAEPQDERARVKRLLGMQ